MEARKIKFLEHYKNSSTLKDAIMELTDVDGAYTDIEFQIEEKLKERLKYEYNE